MASPTSDSPTDFRPRVPPLRVAAAIFNFRQMKALRSLCFLCGSISGILVAATNLECTGVMATGSDIRVALTDKDKGTSRWLALGEGFRGYTFKAYDAATDTAILTKDGAETRLRLNSSKVRDGVGASGKLTPATAKAIYHNLHQIAAAADQYYLEHGTNSTTVANLVGPTNYIKRIVVVAGEDYSGVTLKLGTPVSLTTGVGETMVVDASGNIAGTYAFHMVQPGDTGVALAAKANLSLTELQRLNEEVDFNRLKSGQVVRLK
jgi:LysM repeat protein